MGEGSKGKANRSKAGQGGTECSRGKAGRIRGGARAGQGHGRGRTNRSRAGQARVERTGHDDVHQNSVEQGKARKQA